MHGMAYKNSRRPLAVGQIEFAPQNEAPRMKLGFLFHDSNLVMTLQRCVDGVVDVQEFSSMKSGALDILP
jgi:hypothetical protein